MWVKKKCCSHEVVLCVWFFYQTGKKIICRIKHILTYDVNPLSSYSVHYMQITSYADLLMTSSGYFTDSQ